MIKVSKVLEQKGLEKGSAYLFREAQKAAKAHANKLRKKGVISFCDSEHPSVHVHGANLPEVWENTTIALLGIGGMIHTHYDPGHGKGRHTSFPSIEATVAMHITNPFDEPRFHMQFLAGGMGLGDYIAEIEGVKDGWMIQPAAVAEKLKQGKFDEIKSDERWNYTYSQRFRSFPYFDISGQLQTVNQLKQIVQNLKREPTSRSAQCVTWDPRWDHNTGEVKGADGKPSIWGSYHAPCLQRLWFRLRPNEKGEGYKLNMNSSWRSRDHLKAVPGNILGILHGMYEPVRFDLQKELGVEVQRGEYIDISDSLHLYGHYLDPRSQGKDAEAYLQAIFKIASGEPLAKRIMTPGGDMHQMTVEAMERDYEFRKANPAFGSNM